MFKATPERGPSEELLIKIGETECFQQRKPIDRVIYLSMALNKWMSPEQALMKAKHYCAYQERCHSEVKEKLYSFGLFKQQVEQCLAQLIEEGYLNEERFAKQYAGGKFRLKHWGRIKIRHSLQQKQVSEYCIKKGIREIDEQDYDNTLNKLAEEKWASEKSEKNLFTKLRKTQDYLLQKGFEIDLIKVVLQTLQKDKNQ